MRPLIAQIDKKLSAIAAVGLAIAVSGCQGTGGEADRVLGMDLMTSAPGPVPSVSSDEDLSDKTSPTGDHPPQLGTTCHSSDPNRQCLALKYVVFENSNGIPVVSQQDALAILDAINRIWAQCNIVFEFGEFAAVDPLSYGLTFNTSNYSELDQIRRVFENDSTLLVATTGAWNRSGSLGNTGANAWTNMPGSGLYGAILEGPVGTYSNIVAHELGHYLNLGHVSDSSDVMSPIVYSGSTGLTSGQCGAARSAVQYYWRDMLR